MHPENPSIRSSAFCRRFHFSGRASLLAAVAGCVLTFLPMSPLHATSYADVSLAEMVTWSELIIVADVVPTEDKADFKVVEVLKGTPPDGFTLTGHLSTYEMGGKEKHSIVFSGDVSIPLNDPSTPVRHIFLLRSNPTGMPVTSNPTCGQPETEKARIREILSMVENPVPFVKDGKHDGDTGLIHVVGEKFRRFPVEGDPDPVLKLYLAGNLFIEDLLPWQRVRQEIKFTFDASREVQLQLVDYDEEGAIADFIRHFSSNPRFGSDRKLKEAKLPAQITITLDTHGPEKAGGLTSAEASGFLREQLDSDKEEVVKTTYEALMKMRDTETVPVAMKMLLHPDRKLRKHAAIFLTRARDPRSIEAIAAAIDALPPCIRYSREGYNLEEEELSSALGYAVASIKSPAMLPALKRAAAKGYAGDRMAITLSQLGDESAFEPIITHLRDPKVDHYPDELITLVKRSNLPVEDWMDDGFSSEQREEEKRHSERWIAWWEAHKAELRIVRTWEEAALME